MNESERASFDEILRKTIEGLPEDVAELLAEVPVIVDDEPSAEILREMNIPEDPEPDLCGLHWGIPLAERSMLHELPETSRIHLFRGPILRLAEGQKRELRRQIRITLLHEIGHLFGLTEEDLDDLGYG